QLINTKEYSLHIGGDAQFLLKPAFNRVTGTQALTLSDRPELRIDPTTLISAAIANVSSAQVYSAEFAGSYGPLFGQAEYFHYDVDRIQGLPAGALPSLQFDGWYVEGAWAITGESRPYNTSAGAYGGLVPLNPFTLVGSGWGAWEVAARYST